MLQFASDLKERNAYSISSAYRAQKVSCRYINTKAQSLVSPHYNGKHTESKPPPGRHFEFYSRRPTVKFKMVAWRWFVVGLLLVA